MRKLPLVIALLAASACGGEEKDPPAEEAVDVPLTVWVTTETRLRYTGDRAVVEISDAGVHVSVEALGPDREKWLLEAHGEVGATSFTAEVISGTVEAPGEASLVLEGPGVLLRGNTGTIDVELDRGLFFATVDTDDPALSGHVQGGYNVTCLATDRALCNAY